MDSHAVCPSVSASLPEHRALRGRPRGSEGQRFTPFHGRVVLLRREGPHLFVHHLLMDVWVVSSFSHYKSCCCEHPCTGFFDFLLLCGLCHPHWTVSLEGSCFCPSHLPLYPQCPA